jgi:hypothetical protein
MPENQQWGIAEGQIASFGLPPVRDTVPTASPLHGYSEATGAVAALER